MSTSERPSVSVRVPVEVGAARAIMYLQGALMALVVVFGGLLIARRGGQASEAIEGIARMRVGAAIFLVVMGGLAAGLLLTATKLRRLRWRVGAVALQAVILLPTVASLVFRGNLPTSAVTILIPLAAIGVIVLLYSPKANRAFVAARDPRAQVAVGGKGAFDGPASLD